MATFSVSGLVSGIDYESMIQKIMELERQPITRMESRQTTFKKKISLYGELTSKLSTLKTAAEGLKTATSFYAREATASDDTIFNASAASSAAAGNYTVTVTTLAQAHRIASSQAASQDDLVSAGTGSFRFQVGSGDETSIDVDATTTLSGLRDAINAAEGDAEASIINDGVGYRLVLTARESGAANEITVTQNDTTLDLSIGSGGVLLQAAQDAAFSIDNFAMTRSTNNVEEAIAGVVITLKKEGTATLSVTNDTAAIQQKIEEFVTAYNDVVELVSSNATYDTTTNTGGPFASEATARDVVSRLQAILGARVEGLPEGMRALSQLGVKTGRDGKISIDGSVLSDKLATNLAGVSDLFNAEGGVANALWDYLDEATNSVTGGIAYRTKGLGTIVTRITDDISRVEARLSAEEEAMRARFAKLEALLGSFSTQASYLSSLLG